MAIKKIASNNASDMKHLDYFESGNGVRIICGSDSLKMLPDLLKQNNAARPMVISDANVSQAGLVDRLSQSLSTNPASTAVVEAAPSTCTLAEVYRIARMFTRSDCDSILALGGGSVIDLAKGVNIAVVESVEDITLLGGFGGLMKPLFPLIAVPTTAGSGSEATGTAVISDPDEHRKWFFISKFIFPTAAVIDPNMTIGLSPIVTAAGAMNALAQAIEACVSAARNPISSARAVSAIGLITSNLFNVMKSPDDLCGRTALSLAACLSGMAISDSMAGIVYALGHSLSALCKIPHSLCTAILLPYALSYNLPNIRPIADQLLLHVAGAEKYARIPRHLRAEQLVATLYEINQRLSGLTEGAYAMSLSALNRPKERPSIPQDLLTAVAAAAYNNITFFFHNNYFKESELLNILEHAWEGRYFDKN